MHQPLPVAHAIPPRLTATRRVAHGLGFVIGFVGSWFLAGWWP